MRPLMYLLICLPLTLFAQPKGWQELTISDGLSQGMVFDLEQDQKGFIWIATKDGLNRYDGHNFTVHTHDAYNDYSLSDNYCSALLIDRHRRLWVGTSTQGLNLYDERMQRFYHLDIRDQTSANAGNYDIRSLTEDPEGHLWISTEKSRLFKITLPAWLDDHFPDKPNFTDQVRFEQVNLPETEISDLPCHISFAPDGRAFVGNVYGLYAFNWRQPGAVTRLNLLPKKPTDYLSVYGNARQNFWAASTPDNVVCWQKGVARTIPLPRKNNTSVNLKALDNNTLAIATTDFLWLMTPAELARQDSLTARNAYVAMPGHVYAITDLLRDRTGMLWLGTSGYGLRKFNPRIKQFHSYLPTTTLSYVYADNRGRIYMRHAFAYGQLDRLGDRMVPFLGNELPPADKRQRYMMQDRKGTFWISNVNFETHVQHLFKFSSDWKLLKKYPLPANTAFGFYGNYTIEDRAGYLWIGATNGKLLRFNATTETFHVFSYEALLPQRGAEIETYALHQDRTGTLWAATQRGLLRADHLDTRPRYTIYKNSKTDRQSLSNDFVLSLIDDPYEPDRYLWVGTKGGGLERLNKQTGRFRHITEAQGLPNKVVYGILADEFQNLWLSTNRGLAQFNPRTEQFRHYTKADGLQDDEFNAGSYGKTASGELLFGGVNGITTFRAADVVQAPGPVPLANIIGLKVNNETVDVGGAQPILSEGIEYTQRIDLDHNQNLLTLEFGLMDFTNSARNRYRYRLDGIDRDWVEAGTNRFANYAQLPAGDYTLQMMASPNGETWSRVVELQVRVHPPFYQTVWAYLLYLLALLVVGWQLYRFQTQRLLLQQQIVFEQKEASRLAELDTLKTQFFANISHEFRTPLTLILGPLSDLKRRFPAELTLGLMERNANRLLGLINQLLDLSKLEAGHLPPEPESGDLASFLQVLARSFQSLAESRQIAFSFAQNAAEWPGVFDRDKLEKIVTNLLSNAFKFTTAGQSVRMTVHYPAPGEPNELVMTIQDTGIGIPPAKLPHIFERFYQVDGQASRSYKGSGIGLALVNELINVLKGRIEVASTEGVGTTFTVTLPLSVPAPEPAAAPVSLPGDVAPEPPTSERPRIDPSPKPVPDKILLIIDDNDDVRAYVRSIFEHDYQIIEATDGQAGLEQTTASLPDIVICDLMMPQLDGFGFCRQLKTQEATSHIPVVMLTARSGVGDRIEGFEQGADDYLTKPFNRLEIQARVRNLVHQRERLYQHIRAGLSVADAPPTVPTLPTAEQMFVNRLVAIVEQHLDDTDFSVEALAEAANLSRVQLHRKLKALTNTTATNFIREIRLTKAAGLLSRGDQSVTQVAYTVGFDNLSYFAKVFQEQYGVLPSQYGKATTAPADAPRPVNNTPVNDSR